MTGIVTHTAACVRACALRARRITPARWRELLDAPTVTGVVGILSADGTLPHGVSEAGKVQRTLRQGFIDTAASLARFTHGDRLLAARGFAGWYDLINLEAAMYRLHGGHEGTGVPPYNTGRIGLLKGGEIAAAGNFAALVRALRGSVFDPACRRGLEVYRESLDIARFACEVERGFLMWWLAAARRCAADSGEDDRSFVLHEFISLRLARAAAMMVVRGEHIHAVDDWTAPIGQRIAEEAAPDAVALFRRLADRVHTGKGTAPLGRDVTDFPEAERAADRWMARAAGKAQSGIRFDDNFLFGFLLVRFFETEALSALVECKELGLARDETARLVVTP